MKKSASDNPGMLWRALQFLTCASMLAWLSGCASASYKKADAAGDSLHRAAMEINAENHAIDSTMASLDDLINKPSGDLKPQFDRFNLALNWLVDASNRAEKSATQAQKKSAEYFKSWDKDSASIRFAVVRNQSIARRTMVTDEFNTVNKRYRENQGVVEPLIAYLEDIRTALSADLTPGGLQSVKPLAANARQNAQKVQIALGQLSNELADSGTRMSSVEAQAQGARANAVQTPGAPAQGGVGDTSESTQQQAASTP